MLAAWAQAWFAYSKESQSVKYCIGQTHAALLLPAGRAGLKPPRSMATPAEAGWNGAESICLLHILPTFQVNLASSDTVRR